MVIYRISCDGQDLKTASAPAAAAICWDIGWMPAQHGGWCGRSNVKKNWHDASTQRITIFNSFSDVDWPQFKFLCNITTDCFQIQPLFRGKQYNFDQEKECCISQGSAVTFLRCGEQMHNHLCQICSGFCAPNIIKIGSFWLSYLRNIIGGRLFGNTVSYTKTKTMGWLGSVSLLKQ